MCDTPHKKLYSLETVQKAFELGTGIHELDKDKKSFLENFLRQNAPALITPIPAVSFDDMKNEVGKVIKYRMACNSGKIVYDDVNKIAHGIMNLFINQPLRFAIPSAEESEAACLKGSGCSEGNHQFDCPCAAWDDCFAWYTEFMLKQIEEQEGQQDKINEE